MLWKQDPITRKQILNSIDNFLIKELSLEEKDIPWFNKKKDNLNGYLDFMTLLRLAYVRLYSEYYDRHHKKIH